MPLIITKRMWEQAYNKLQDYFGYCANDMYESAIELERRYDKGERSRDLYNLIAALEEHK